MAITEISHTGWFGRIGSSIKGILFGLILIVGSIILHGWNEKNAVADIRANKEIAGEVISVSNERIDPLNEGKLIHLNGSAKTNDVVTNEAFGIEENAIRISWDSEIYQWVENKETKTEKKLGGGEKTVTHYSYQKKWIDRPVDSSKFKEQGHDNLGKLRFPDGSSQAETVTLGTFKLSPKLITQMRWSEPYPLEALPEDFEGPGTVESGVFHTGLPDQPEIGDERLSFTITRPDDVSVMGVQTGDTFSAYQTESGKEKLLLYQGLLTAEQVVEGEERKAMFLRWGLRALGIILMFLGFNLILRPLSVLADVIPLLGSMVGFATGTVSLLLSVGISFVVIAIAWISFRPMIGIPLLLVGICCFVMIILKLVKGRRQANLTPPPPRPA